MKKIFYLFLALPLLLLGACGDDSDNENDNMSTDKRISKIVQERDGMILEHFLKYDNEGRVIEVNTNLNDGSKTGRFICTYQYGESIIFKKEVMVEKYVSGATDGYPMNHTFVLENGKVSTYSYGVKKDNSISFFYNDEDYIDARTYYKEGGPGKLSFRWKNGNLEGLYYPSGNPELTCTYSNIPWKKGLILSLGLKLLHGDVFIDYTDPILFANGYYGKLPQNLPSKINRMNFEYTVSGGYVTKIVKTQTDTLHYDLHPEDNRVIYYRDIMNLTWE